EFRRLGLRPAGDEGTFIQRFPFDASELDRSAVLVEARGRGATSRLTFGDDYFVIPARVDSAVGTPIFMGPARPGVMPPAEAAGRPLVFFVSDTAMMAWQTAAGAALQSSLAARAGTVLLVMAPEFPQETMQMLASELAGQILQVPMPVVGMRYDAAKQIFQRAGIDLDARRTSNEPATLEGITVAVR